MRERERALKDLKKRIRNLSSSNILDLENSKDFGYVERMLRSREMFEFEVVDEDGEANGDIIHTANDGEIYSKYDGESNWVGKTLKDAMNSEGLQYLRKI